MFTRRANRALSSLACLVIAVAVIVLLAAGDASSQNLQVAFESRIDALDLGEEFTTPLVLKNPTGLDLDEFNLLISYPSHFLNFVEIVPTPDNPECVWTAFDVTPIGDSLIRIVGSTSTTCLSADSLVLASLSFQVSADSSAVCQGGFFTFVFNECTDNTIHPAEGGSLLFADTVMEGQFYWPPPENRRGASDSCVSALGGVRDIKYLFGYVNVDCGPPAPERGDLNVDGLTFTIADWVIYTNYFVSGMDAFSPFSVDQAVPNSDCNADDRTLTIADMVFTHLVIVGDTLPFPFAKGVNDTAVFTQDMSTKTVDLDYVEPVASIFLEFGGEIAPTPLFDTTNGMEIAYAVVDGHTRVLVIFPLAVSGEPTVPPGSILSYTGDAALLRSDLSTWDAFWVPSGIDYLNGSCCIGQVGNVNYSLDDEVDISDLTSLVNFLFLDPTQVPLCLAEANVNGDLSGEIDISDLTALVSYLFALSTDPLPVCQ